jgi:lipoate-protein ligase A
MSGEGVVRKSYITRIPGGKTLKIDISIRGDIIENIVISGDFFAYPEEMVDELESAIRGHKLSDVIGIVEDFRNRIVFLGVSIDDIINALRKITG